MTSAAANRIAALDLTRGIAVLGILAVNIAGLAGPIAATLSPHIPAPGTLADKITFTAMFVVFEGKMRMLFAMLFGASLALFIERADASGRAGTTLQARRIGWLALLGVLHWLLFWWGDILFTYAVIGLVALALHRQPVHVLLSLAGVLFVGWVGLGLIMTMADAQTAAAAQRGITNALTRDLDTRNADMVHQAAAEVQRYLRPLPDQIWHKLTRQPLWLPNMALANVFEILPAMLVGMTLYRTGFFSGAWPRTQLLQMTALGIGLGGALTLWTAWWVWRLDFPPMVMGGIAAFWTALPRPMMMVGYAALVVISAPRLLDTGIGRALARVGTMALTNYIGTTVLMTAIFYGWGLGLVGQFSHAQLWPFLLGGWVAMLAASTLWLARYRQGPLEWLWRCLTEWRWLPLRRPLVIATHSH